MNPAAPVGRPPLNRVPRSVYRKPVLGDVFVESHPPDLSYWREPWHIEDVLPIPASPPCANRANRYAVG